MKMLLNKQRIERNNHSQISYTHIDEKNAIVVVGGNPNNFHQIQMVSKQFVKMCEYKEEQLLQRKLQILIPSFLDQYHETILKKYLMKCKYNDNYISVLPQQWLRLNNGSVKPVMIKSIPKVSLDNGIYFVGIFSEMNEFSIFDKKTYAKYTYCIITDQNDKIYHMSVNLFKNFPISDKILEQDLTIHSILFNIPDNFEENESYQCDLDLTNLIEESFKESKQTKLHKLSMRFIVQLTIKEKKFQEIICFREFYFIILQQRLENGSEILSMTDIQIGNMNVVGDGMINLLEFQHELTSSNNDENYQIKSMSSTMSSSTSETNKAQNINDIKNVIDFSNLPKSLKNYRIKLLFGFLFFLFSTIGMMVVNIQVKNSFVNNLDAVVTEKQMRNQYQSIMLASINLLGVSNLPKTFDLAELDVNVPDHSFINFYRDRMDSLVDLLHNAMNEFSKSSQSWNQNFVAMVNKEEFEIIQITDYGNLMTDNTTFAQAIKMYMQQADYISKIDPFYYSITSFNIFDVNTMEDYAMLIERLWGIQMSYMQSIYYIIFNGSYSMLKQMVRIDTAFIDQIIRSGNGLVIIIVSVTISFCVVTFFIITYFLSYLFQIETAQQRMLSLQYHVSSSQIEQLQFQSEEFMIFLQGNSYLNQQNIINTTQVRKNIIEDKPQKTGGNKDSYQTQYDKQESNNFLALTTNPKLKQNQFIITDEANNNLEKGSLKKKKGNENNSIQKKKINKKIKDLFEEEKEENIMTDNNIKNKSDRKQNQHSEQSDDQNTKKKKHDKEKKNSHEKCQTINDDKTEENVVPYKKITAYKKKLFIILALYIGAFLVCGFYLLTFQQSYTLLKAFQQGFIQLDVFYSRIPCITSSIFFLQKSYFNNESMINSTENGQRINQVEEECQNNEKQYRDIIKDADGTFEKILKILSILDSEEFCSFYREQNLTLENLTSSDCETVGGGILKLGLSQFIQMVMTYTHQLRVQDESVPVSQKTNDMIQKLYFQPKNFQYSLIYYKYVQQALIKVEQMADSGMRLNLNDDFQKVILVFSIFMALLLIIEIFLQTGYIKILKNKLSRIRFLMKMISTQEIVRLNDKFGQVNIKLL